MSTNNEFYETQLIKILKITQLLFKTTCYHDQHLFLVY